MKRSEKHKRIYTWSLGITFILCSVFASVGFAEESIHSGWSTLLQKHVQNGQVDYLAFKKDEQLLDDYLKILDKTDPEKLSENERFALYVNAYNAYTVKLIIDNFENGKPVDSIKDLGGFFSGPWKIKFARVGGKEYTLDNIEHDILRPTFKEPRVHFAVNCASKSCPPLINEAYEGETLDSQLEKNTIAFLNDEKFNHLKGNSLYVTKIFSWFSEDFKGGVVPFVKKYARGELKKNLEAVEGKISVKYLDYDWSLNIKE